jgi:hypothetical protein
VFIIYELVGEPGAASHASVGVIDAIHLPLSFEHAIPAALGPTIGPKSHVTCSPDQFPGAAVGSCRCLAFMLIRARHRFLSSAASVRLYFANALHPFLSQLQGLTFQNVNNEMRIG